MGSKLDRVVFTAYLLGAVVPLLALAYVAQRYVIPTLTDPVASFGLVGLVISIAALSLGSFFSLRRTTRHSLERMDGDNQRLASLLEVSGALAAAEDAHDAAARGAECALALAGASAAFVLAHDEAEGHPVLLESAGESAPELYAAHGKTLTELAELVETEGRPALRGPESDPGPGDDRAKQMGAAAVIPLVSEDRPLGAVAVLRADSRAFDAARVDALSTLAALLSVALRNADLRDAQRNFFSHVTEILAAALDSHVHYHKGHGKRVAELANRVGREMGLDAERRQRLHFAALLHDMGMLKLDHPHKLNAKALERHAGLGARLLSRIRLWKDIAPAVAHHHERWDGTGYPDGLAGDDIPLESRIIAVCDAFDTMSSNASYKVAMPVSECLQEIEISAGSQFDPQIVRVFSRLVAGGEIEAEGFGAGR